jgi:hypothetical protein
MGQVETHCGADARRRLRDALAGYQRDPAGRTWASTVKLLDGVAGVLRVNTDAATEPPTLTGPPFPLRASLLRQFVSFLPKALETQSVAYVRAVVESANARGRDVLHRAPATGPTSFGLGGGGGGGGGGSVAAPAAPRGTAPFPLSRAPLTGAAPSAAPAPLPAPVPSATVGAKRPRDEGGALDAGAGGVARLASGPATAASAAPSTSHASKRPRAEGDPDAVAAPPASAPSPGGGGGGGPGLKCAICHDRAVDAAAATCGHVCCRGCWRSWLAEKSVCPICRSLVREKFLIPLHLNE